MKTLKRMCGVTLIELMTTCSVAAISLTLGVPTFTSVHLGMQRREVCQEFMSTVTLARSEAARRGVTVRLCASADGSTCTTAANPDWNLGWILATDVDNDGVLDAGTDTDGDGVIDQGQDEIIHAAHFSNPAFSLTTDVHGGGSAGTIVAFGGSGFPAAAGSFTYCDPGESRVLTLSYVGRVEQTAIGRGCQ